MSDVPLGDFYVRGMTPSVFNNFLTIIQKGLSDF